MTFAWPHLLWLLALPAAFLLWDAFRLRRAQANSGHAKIVRAEAGASRVSLSVMENGRAGRKLPRFWLSACLALACVALARPQWGRIEEQVFEQSREIIIGFDLSRSMNAPDVKPTRLERAKLLVRALLDRLEGERVGLIVFSSTAFLQAPLSTDYEILRDFLPDLKPGFLPEGGTNFQSLLKTSLDAFGKESSADRFLIVLSDGEDLDERWRPLLPAIKEKKLRIIALGVGTPEGAMIPEEGGSFVKDERGAVVMTHLAPETLQELARESRGVYRDASTWVDLATVLKETVEAGKEGAFSDKRAARAIERYQWVLAPALLCLLASLLFEFPARIRPRLIQTVSDSRIQRTAAAIALALALASLIPGNLRAQQAAAPDSPLFATVKRLSDKPSLSVNDCADFAKRTIEWGRSLQSAQQPIPEGPVRDGLQAVDTGALLNDRAHDWAGLRHDLEALLTKKEPPPEEKKDDQKKQDQQNQNENQDKQDQKQDQQDQKQDQEQQNQQQEKQQDQQKQSAFGKMDQKEQAPPPKPEEMQQVGGSDRKPPPEREDPSMVLPLEKLEKIKNQDSPARLFQLMEDEKKEPPPSQPKKKNW